MKAKPGEVSLAHNGVLFLDELPEYQRQTLEALRQPLEDGFVNVTRISGQAKYQSRCMLVASMNPCPCGNHGSKSKPCRCKPNEIKRYLARISGPLLDRIDIQVEMDAVEIDDIREAGGAGGHRTPCRSACVTARNLQLERYKNESFFCNAQMPQEGIEKYCAMEDAARAMLHSAVEKFHISMRTYGRICKVARTVADLNGREVIQPQDIARGHPPAQPRRPVLEVAWSLPKNSAACCGYPARRLRRTGCKSCLPEAGSAAALWERFRQGRTLFQAHRGKPDPRALPSGDGAGQRSVTRMEQQGIELLFSRRRTLPFASQEY